jgi:pimeloyl-ACP methyl ester carboxylesterase
MPAATDGAFCAAQVHANALERTLTPVEMLDGLRGAAATVEERIGKASRPIEWAGAGRLRGQRLTMGGAMAIPDRRVGFTWVALTASVVGGCAVADEEPPDPVPTTSTVVSVDGSSISYDIAGDGPTALVFVHGWSCNRTYFDAQVADFVTDHRVVRLDLAGHGTSGMERRDYSISSFGADVAAVAESLDLHSMILIGHSMGGDVITEAAKLLPGRVEGLIWVDTYKSLPINRTEVAVNALESALRYAREIPAALELLRLPVFAINADNSPTDEGSLRRYGVEPIIMSGVGHFLMMEDPSRFNAVLRQALQRIHTSRPHP